MEKEEDEDGKEKGGRGRRKSQCITGTSLGKYLFVFYLFDEDAVHSSCFGHCSCISIGSESTGGEKEGENREENDAT